MTHKHISGMYSKVYCVHDTSAHIWQVQYNSLCTWHISTYLASAVQFIVYMTHQQISGRYSTVHCVHDTSAHIWQLQLGLLIVFENFCFVFQSFSKTIVSFSEKTTHSFQTFRKQIAIVFENDRFYKNDLRPFFYTIVLKKQSF